MELAALAVAAALALSAAVVRLPGRSGYSAAGPLLLWAGGHAPLLALLALPVQALLYHRRGLAGPALYLEAIALLTALGTQAIGRSLRPSWTLGWTILSAALYVVFLNELRWRHKPPGDGRVAFMRMQRRLRWLTAGSVCAGFSLNAGWGWAALPLLASTHWVAANERFRVQAELAEELRQSFERMQRELVTLARVKDDLQASQQERDWLEQLSQALPRATSVETWANAVAASLQRVTRWDTLAIFQQGLLLHGCSPELERLRNAPLLGLHEPLVQQAGSTGQPQLRQSGSDGLVSQEVAAVAVPLAEGLVFYLGRKQTQWTTVELRWLVWTLQRAWPVLGNLLEAEHERRRLAESQQQTAALSHQVGQLESLLRSTQQLSLGLPLDTLLTQLPAMVAEVAAHEWGFLCDSSQTLLSSWGTLPACTRGFAELITHQGRPWLVDSWAEVERFAGEQGSALGVPLFRDAELWGCLAIGCAHPSRYSREKLHTLTLFANQLALAVARGHALEDLRQSQQHIIASSKMVAVGQLAAGVAHELNSPLGAISLMLDGARRQLKTQVEAADGKLDRAQQACQRARHIVDGLLQHSRQNPLEAQPYRLGDCLREALAFVEPQLRELKADLRVHLDENPTLHGQSSGVQQVMINLLLNAAHAYGDSEERPIQLASHEWGFTVADAGPGIPSELQARIFEPFFTTRASGHGLGLWICRDLLAQQGGTIGVQSQPGEGTTFLVKLK